VHGRLVAGHAHDRVHDDEAVRAGVDGAEPVARLGIWRAGVVRVGVAGAGVVGAGVVGASVVGASVERAGVDGADPSVAAGVAAAVPGRVDRAIAPRVLFHEDERAIGSAAVDAGVVKREGLDADEEPARGQGARGTESERQHAKAVREDDPRRAGHGAGA
jgi:hypothetical protein